MENHDFYSGKDPPAPFNRERQKEWPKNKSLRRNLQRVQEDRDMLYDRTRTLGEENLGLKREKQNLEKKVDQLHYENDKSTLKEKKYKEANTKLQNEVLASRGDKAKIEELQTTISKLEGDLRRTSESQQDSDGDPKLSTAEARNPEQLVNSLQIKLELTEQSPEAKTRKCKAYKKKYEEEHQNYGKLQEKLASGIKAMLGDSFSMSIIEASLADIGPSSDLARSSSSGGTLRLITTQMDEEEMDVLYTGTPSVSAATIIISRSSDPSTAAPQHSPKYQPSSSKFKASNHSGKAVATSSRDNDESTGTVKRKKHASAQSPSLRPTKRHNPISSDYLQPQLPLNIFPGGFGGGKDKVETLNFTDASHHTVPDFSVFMTIVPGCQADHLPNSILPSKEFERVEGQLKHWMKSNPNWKTEANNHRLCLGILNLSGTRELQFSRTDGKMAACRVCTNARRPCMWVRNGKIFLLPLDSTLRVGRNINEPEFWKYVALTHAPDGTWGPEVKGMTFWS